MIKPRLHELGDAMEEFDGIVSRIRARADSADLSDEKGAERLGRAIKRLTDELKEINRKWNGKS